NAYSHGASNSDADCNYTSEGNSYGYGAINSNAYSHGASDSDADCDYPSEGNSYGYGPRKITCHLTQSPVTTQGVRTMHISVGAINRASDGQGYSNSCAPSVTTCCS